MFEAEKINVRVFSYDLRLRRVKRFVDDHIQEPVSLETAARVAGYEKTYFSAFFHRETGVCFRDWLNWVRVTHAVELMASHNMSITDVAFAVGFRDLRTFERASEKCTGLTPRAMKERLRPRPIS